jgi:hypothetical protein
MVRTYKAKGQFTAHTNKTSVTGGFTLVIEYLQYGTEYLQLNSIIYIYT